MVGRRIFFLFTFVCVGQAAITYTNTLDFLNDSYKLAILEL